MKRKTNRGFEQLSLGDVIKKLEAVKRKSELVQFDFEFIFPTRLDSWRGSYDEVALGYDLGEYNTKADAKNDWPTVKKMIERLKDGLEYTFEGWKGGEYIYTEETPLWVSNRGNNGYTVITDVYEGERYEKIILLTDYCEYTLV